MPKGNQRDYYEVLGVTRTAAVDEIKSAYRKAALKWHPDRNPENKRIGSKVRECTEAYSVLTDAQKRQIYDTYGHAGLSSSAGQGFDNTVFQDFHDIFGDFLGFEDLFGGGGTRRGRNAHNAIGSALHMSLTFEEASAGVTTKIKLPRQEFCEACNGTGAKKAPVFKLAKHAPVAGSLRTSRDFHHHAHLPRLPGRWTNVKERCLECRGQGRMEREKTSSCAFRRCGYRHAPARCGEGRTWTERRTGGDCMSCSKSRNIHFSSGAARTCIARFR